MMADWDPESPEAWARALGLVSVPMFGRERASRMLGRPSVLLDGELASFALFAGNSEELLAKPEPLSWSWSSNLTHTFFVDKSRDSLLIRRWDTTTVESHSPLPSVRQASLILDELDASRPPIAPTVIDRMIGVFRVVRHNVETLRGSQTDVVHAFNALVVVADALSHQHLSTAAFAEVRFLRDALNLIRSMKLISYGPESVSVAVQNLDITELALTLLAHKQAYPDCC
jgi:hypothetical protein